MMRFTIRDLLWLTVVVALAVAWWVDRSGLEEERSHWRWEYTYLLHETGHVSMSDESWAKGPRAKANSVAPPLNP